ncbi:MAG: type III-A CRISPR-associated RAMP protein Csm5 [Thermoflavifilum sp.]|nr:type III-A CRISPR-associated RAMP protein Csm5 [Thermoflavifilum sp.]
MMNNLEIQTLTPVHIGSGQILKKNVDFIFYSNIHNYPIAIIDDSKFLAIIGEEKINKWLHCIEEKKDLRSEFSRELAKISLDQIAKRIIYSMTNPGRNELYEHIHNASLKPYIPGSSLKGAIRTALLSYLFRTEPSFFKKNFVLGMMKEKKYQKLNRKLITHFVADDEIVQNNKDIFRFLHVGDAIFDQTKAIFITTYSKSKIGWELKDNLSQWTECIPDGLSSHLRINFAKQIIEANKDKQIQELIKENIGKNYVYLYSSQLFQIINKHTHQLLKKELDFVKHEEIDDYYREQLQRILDQVADCKQNECILRVGKHNGYLFTTGGWQKELIDKPEYDNLINSISKRNYDNLPFPKTRRFANVGKPIGFVKLIIK